MCQNPIRMDFLCGYNNESERERSWVAMLVVKEAGCSVLRWAGAMGGRAWERGLQWRGPCCFF